MTNKLMVLINRILVEHPDDRSLDILEIHRMSNGQFVLSGTEPDRLIKKGREEDINRFVDSYYAVIAVDN